MAEEESREYQLMRELARIRKYRGLTQVQVAEKMSVNQSTVSELELAEHMTGVKKLWNYLDAIGVRVVLLMNEQDQVIFEVQP